MSHRLFYTERARHSLNSIAIGIVEAGGEPSVARNQVERLRGKCRALAGLPGALGRARGELGLELRSFALGNYVIFFRYVEDTFEVVDIVDGRRDLDRYFADE